MPIRIASFAGEIPRLIPRLLGDNYAQIAQNTKLENGNLLPIRRGRFIKRLDEAAKTIYKNGDDWISWPDHVKVVPGPIAEDRLYITGDGAPKVMVGGITTPLALPRPTSTPTAATSSTPGTTFFTVLCRLS